MRSGVLAAVLGTALVGVWLPSDAWATPEEVETEDAVEETPGLGESDPLRWLNRKIFWFNEQADRWVIEPVATGWDFIMPDRVQTSLRNFFDNLRFPIVTLNDMLQWKPKAAGTDVARFLVNTTVGVAGFFDPATGWGLPASDEDFGQTLGVWGVPPGPYLVIPILGPSNIRDGAGLIVDRAASVTPFFVDSLILLGVSAFDLTNRRSLVLEEIDEARAASLDFYSAVRSAYAQRRDAQVRDTTETEADEEEELYFLEY